LPELLLLHNLWLDVHFVLSLMVIFSPQLIRPR